MYADNKNKIEAINNNTQKAVNPDNPVDVNSIYARYDYKYNGMELQDELGLNMYAMDMRQYDPAIARWVVMDPVAHHSMSPYNAFDNNPVFWADPSGADATEFIDFRNDNNDWWVRYMNSKQYLDDYTIASNGGTGDPPTGGESDEPIYEGDTVELPEAVIFGSKDTGLKATALRAYKNSYDPRFSPYSPDAFSIGGNFGLRAGVIHANISVSLAVTGGDMAIVVGGDYGLGLPLEKPGLGGGLFMNIHDNYGGNRDVLAGLGGTDIVYYGGYEIMGSYATSAEIVSGGAIPAKQGVRSYGLGVGMGAGVSNSHSEVFKLSNGIKNMSQGISTMKNNFLQAVHPPSILTRP